MLEKIKSLNAEKIILFLIILSFFIGTWHAFPMLNVIGGETFYVGAVLRAMENHTIFPAPNEVPYGTLTYIINYIVTAISLLFYFPFFGFSVVNLKAFLLQNPTIMYLSLRILSACFATIMLFLVNKVLKKEFDDWKVRCFLLVLLFTNIITTTLLHTGKMWVLSMLLVLASFFYLYKSLSNDDSNLKKNIFLTIIFSFLAVSNFPLNLYSLVSIPVLLFCFRKSRIVIIGIIKYTAFGFGLYILITLFNFEGIRNQVVSIFTEYHPVENSFVSELNFGTSLYYYGLKIICLFPLFLITLLLSLKKGIKNRNLLLISSLYFFSYLFLITIVANWATDMQSSLRYLFPLGFFLTFILASLDLKFNKLFYVIGSISVMFGLMFLYYLSVPTTYNKAFGWVNNTLADKEMIIINNVDILQLTKNKKSYLLQKPEFCATKCKNTIDLDLNKDFKPVVSDLLVSNTPDVINYNGEVYYIEENKLVSSDFELIKSFDNKSKLYHTIDYNIGNYFDVGFFQIKNFGKNIYVYRKR